MADFREPKITSLANWTFAAWFLVPIVLFFTSRSEPDFWGPFLTLTFVGTLLAWGLTRLGIRSGKDMGRRGQSEFIWGTAVMVTFPIGLMVWLVARRSFPITSDSENQSV